METKITFTFTFKIQERSFDFRVDAKTEQEALISLKADLSVILGKIPV